jgi:uncharacterized protein YciI
MNFVIVNRDKPDGGDIRADTRPVHLDYLRAAGDALILAGPLLDDAGDAPCGSLLIIEAADLAEAERFAAGDPYAKAGLFATSTVMPWRQTFPEA